MKKEIAINTINSFPNKFELEELLERLVFIEKIEKGFEQAQSGQTIDHELLIKKYQDKWLK